MAVPLTDLEREHYFTALELALTTSGYVVLKASSQQRLKDELLDFGLTSKGLAQEMWANREKVKKITETRPGYEEPYHFDFVFDVRGMKRKMYVETVLDMGQEPDDSVITIVNIHETT